ncbi:hypothetical protein EIN_172070 [Entamoeba invadens IP1]|uniref:VPS9 domain-containing protein n=1 Tax=Entamoeba invadens IP1 TaxID=370355 RepID=A0A0A1TVU1_ENTIV|nr:hypothetical protein EIN_172070 [Entamoeba invadens IP1]ELP84602.1 hypothetical protein EIN_172070 [Entamoeba invadens IP1]|eukprot:XP_004183948.1 hypothetical protein EIN_172070 [Entamoeba invadens IP1]
MSSQLTDDILVKFSQFINEHQTDVEPIKQFRDWFENHKNNTTHEEQVKMVDSCMLTLLFNFSQYDSPFTREVHFMCVENLVFSNFYEDVFLENDSLKIDEQFALKCKELSDFPIEAFRPTRNIHLPRLEPSFEQLRSINNYKTPTEKVESIVNALKPVLYFDNTTTQMTCDDIIAVVSYILCNAQSPLLYSNLCFIRDFDKGISTEGDFFVTQVEVAVQNILGSQKEEMDRYMDEMVGGVESKIVSSPPVSNANSQVKYCK